MEFIFEYSIFLAKAITVVASIIIILGLLLFFFIRSKDMHANHLKIESMNKKYEDMQLMLSAHIMKKKDFKHFLKQRKKTDKEQKTAKENKNTLFFLNFKGDIKASRVSSLREEITAILNIANDGDEVLVLLESGGGTIHGYGLGLAQLKRIRDRGLKLTVAVDKVAASGGYMMACIAHQIICAPFAIIGSVGVIMQLPNFNRLLKKNNIDFEQVSSGEYKRTLTLFGENTEKDREKLQKELDEAHLLFKQLVKEYRKDIDIDKVATGEYWYGKQALSLHLVDALTVSDDYLMQSAKTMNVLSLNYVQKKALNEKFAAFGTALCARLLYKIKDMANYQGQ